MKELYTVIKISSETSKKIDEIRFNLGLKHTTETIMLGLDLLLYFANSRDEIYIKNESDKKLNKIDIREFILSE